MLWLLSVVSWVTDRSTVPGCLLLVLCLVVSPVFPLALLAIPVVWLLTARSPD